MSKQTITEFLEARIAEEEAAANAVSFGPHWEEDPESYIVLHDGDGICYDIVSEDVSQHIASYDPARIIEECKAKRAIVHYCAGLGVGRRVDVEVDAQFRAALWIAQQLAQVYKDHPDYRHGWL